MTTEGVLLSVGGGSWFVLPAAVFFVREPPSPLRVALPLAARFRAMLLGGAMFVARNREGMQVADPIGPGAPPRPVSDDDRMSAPLEPTRTPAPRSPPCAHADSVAETDRGRNAERWPRGHEHDRRIVVRHHDEDRIDRQDLDVRAARHGDL